MAIYLDHAATTPLHPEVLEAMLPYLTEHHGNPSSIHASGRRARQGLDEAREEIASHIGAKPREIIFTASGTEADNLAVKGVAWAASARGRHIVTSAVEHKAILNTTAILERQGFQVTAVSVDGSGRVEPADIAAAITDATTLVTIQAANNEVGTLQPIAAIGAICRERRVTFHVDAVQSAAFLPPAPDAWQATLISLSAHKLYGPKGIGALYVRQGTAMVPQLNGGAQERQRRAGTENVAGAVGFARAMRLAYADAPDLAPLGDRLIRGLVALEGVQLTGHQTDRLPNSASVVIDGVEGGDLVAALDLEGIEASTGSACTTGSTEPSHVLLAMGVDPELAHGSLRLTIGRGTTEADIDRTLEVVAACIGRLRIGGPVGAATA
ncbi:MAG TPA: cysteine desulfurase family protein [Candidatus Limnocylindria bacterium]|nr:cysteine desulfurase family protein [Candidatus Limnocylindria bacterium]